eukprot:NODE_124_length_17341_cov_0.560028.p6 type:complete len:418 gc:universal NODE_124_length_17341_cov_0.560028:4568-3315(-)
MSVKDWDLYHVLCWLDMIKMSHYQEQFITNHINGFCLLKLEHSLLKELKVHKVGDRIKILSEIRRLYNGYLPQLNPDKVKELKRTWVRLRQSSKENISSSSTLDRYRVILKITGEDSQTIQVGVTEQMSYKDVMQKILSRFGLSASEANLNQYNLLNASGKAVSDADLLAIIRDPRTDKDKLVLRKRHIPVNSKARKVHKLENFFGEDFDGKLPSADVKQSTKLNKFFGTRPPSALIGQHLQDYFPRDTIAELRRVSKVPDVSNLMLDSSPSSLQSSVVNTPEPTSPRRAKSDRKPDLKINTDSYDQAESLPDSPSSLESAGPIKFIKGNLIGKGSFGSVYLGMNAVNGELLAVKMVEMPTEEGPNFEMKKKMYRALQKEIAILKQLNHPHIVRYLGSQIQENYLNIFLEYVPGSRF